MFTDDCVELIEHINATEPSERVRTMATRVIMRGADSFPSYVNSVVMLENATRISKYAFGPEDVADWQATVSRADKRRNADHDSAQTACASINRLCDRYGFGRHICPEVPDDPVERKMPHNRDVVADFAAGVTFETYLDQGEDMYLEGMSDDRRELLTAAVDYLKKSGMSSYDTGLVSGAVERGLAEEPSGGDDDHSVDGEDEAYTY